MNITKEQLRKLIKEIVTQNNIKDPSKEEMITFLKKSYGSEPEFLDTAEIAMYWFANHYHGGQWSNLYSVLSTSRFRPGPIARGPEKGSAEEMMYEDLVLHFAPSSEEAKEIQSHHASLNEGDEADAVNDMWAGSDDDLRGHDIGLGKHKGSKRKSTLIKPKKKALTVQDFDWSRIKQKIDKGTLKETSDEDVDYVEYVSQRSGEEPFKLRTPNGLEKFEFVNAKYPSGKVDIGVYAFRGDVVYGYSYFKKLYKLP